ncbi:Endonuclease/exonuclease/phosphatase, partial [Hygrophoropsis aurantiaca]
MHYANHEWRRGACSSWRISIWRSWRDRVQSTNTTTSVKSVLSGAPRNGLLSLNVNGFHSKRVQLEDLLDQERVAVCALQETLVSQNQYPVVLPGYNTFAAPWKEGFRGAAVLVDQRLAAYEIPHGKEKLEGYKFLIHVKVSGLSGLSKPLHFIAAYLPSGGAYRALRTSGLEAIIDLFKKILDRERGAMIVCMGDLNAEPQRLDKVLARSADSALRFAPRGSALTRFPIRGRLTALDHMVVSPMAREVFLKPRVRRDFSISDHRPLVSRVRIKPPKSVGHPYCSLRYDSKKLVYHSERLANDNRWLALEGLEVDSAEKLSVAAKSLQRTSTKLFRRLGVVTDSRPTDVHTYMPKHMKTLLDRYKSLSRRVSSLLDKGEALSDGLSGAYERARKKFRREKDKFELQERQKTFTRIADDFLIHDHKNVWSRLRAQTDTRHRGDAPAPVRNAKGELCVDVSSILDATRDHYQSLAQDDPEGLSRNDEHW